MKGMAGRKWLQLFPKRHPEISMRISQQMNTGRAMKLNRFIVKYHFTKLKDVMNDIEVMSKPERIYNMDDKGCRLTIHHQQTVLARKGAKIVNLIAPEHGENFTTVSCDNASGQTIPPIILFKGKRLKPE
jgi:hypothetical protein